MENIYRTRMFRRFFITIVSVTVLVFLALYFVVMFRSQIIADKLELEEVDVFREQIVDHLSDWRDERRSDIVELSSTLDVISSEKIFGLVGKRHLDNLIKAHSSFSDLFVVSPSGAIIVSTTKNISPNINVADRDYYRASMAGKIFVSGYFIDRIHFDATLAISAPVYGSNNITSGVSKKIPIAIVVGLVPIHDVLRIINNTALIREMGSVSLVDANFQQIGTDKSNIVKLIFPMDKIGTDNVVSAKYINSYKQEVFGSYEKIDSLRLGIIVELSAKRVLQPLYEILRFVQIFALLMIFALILLSGITSARLLRPINELANAAEAMAENRYKGDLAFNTRTEIDKVGEYFDRMVKVIKERETVLLETASRDSLTGLFNHAKIEDFLETEVKRKRRENIPVAFIMVDIDFFKKINDTYGHQAGDSTLRGVACILEKNTREGDIVGRYGGEEFSIIPVDSSDSVGVFCERLRQAIESGNFPYLDKEIKITVSIGWTVGDPHEVSHFDLVHKADMALYQSKAEGRNRVSKAS
jgi:diguanylate cyclase (GGDEF)-like protein